MLINVSQLALRENQIPMGSIGCFLWCKYSRQDGFSSCQRDITERELGRKCAHLGLAGHHQHTARQGRGPSAAPSPEVVKAMVGVIRTPQPQLSEFKSDCVTPSGPQPPSTLVVWWIRARVLELDRLGLEPGSIAS